MSPDSLMHMKPYVADVWNIWMCGEALTCFSQKAYFSPHSGNIKAYATVSQAHLLTFYVMSLLAYFQSCIHATFQQNKMNLVVFCFWLDTVFLILLYIVIILSTLHVAKHFFFKSTNMDPTIVIALNSPPFPLRSFQASMEIMCIGERCVWYKWNMEGSYIFLSFPSKIISFRKNLYSTESKSGLFVEPTGAPERQNGPL